jgi:hypothetical protein
MPLGRINHHLLHFVHVPKTGGASVTDYMRKKGTVALYSREELAWAQSTPQHLEYEVSRMLIPQGFADASFLILRDPLERLLSEFRYRATRYDSKGPITKKLTACDEIKIELDWDQEFEGTFDEWVALVFDICAESPNACDNHIRPQVDFIGPEMKVFLFERGLQKVYNWIDTITDTPAILTPLDRNESKKFDIEVSDTARARIKEFYERDYYLISNLRNMAGDYQDMERHAGAPSFNKCELI